MYNASKYSGIVECIVGTNDVRDLALSSFTKINFINFGVAEPVDKINNK